MPKGARRTLDSFAPFRPDEIVESKFFDKNANCDVYEYYPYFGGRLRVAHETFQPLKIRTTIIQHELRDKAIVHASVEGFPRGKVAAPAVAVEMVEGAGIGTADKIGDGRLADSLLELAETRAIGRALRAMGIGADMVGAEEMARAGIVERDSKPYNAPAGANGGHKPPVTPPGPQQQAATPPPPQVTPKRRELGDKIMEAALVLGGAQHQKDWAARLLSCMIPGKVSPAQLSDGECAIVDLILRAAFRLDSEQAVIDTKRALQTTIGSQTEVHLWTAQHVDAALKAIGKQMPSAPLVPPPVQQDDIPF